MKKIISMVLVCLIVAGLLHSISLAWLSDNGLSSPIDITSNVNKNYFDSGNGSKETPYIIATPVQLYYFAWLQYLGYFNPDEDNNLVIDNTFYFALKNDIDMHVVDENGQVVEYVLPPIGTTDNPFLGNFDGRGFTVKNATVENYYSSLIEPPYQTSEENFGGAEIIGFFGVVGSIDDTYLYESQANEVKNLVLENITVKTQTAQSLIGLVAGYVNGHVDGVGVVGGTVNIVDGVKALSYTANISDYSLIGFCTPEFKDSVYVMDVVLSNPGITDSYTIIPDKTGSGENLGWGGSVKMSDIYKWLYDVRTTKATSTTSYTTARVDVTDLAGKTVTVDDTNETRLTYSVDDFGSFVFTSSSPDYVNFVSGSQKVTQYKYAYSENDVSLYYITDGTNYLCFDGEDITSTTNEDEATKWYSSNGANGGNIYMVIDKVVYYLTIDNNRLTAKTFSVLPDDLPSWGFTSNSLSYNSQRIECDNGNWNIASNTTTTYLISRDSSYLSVKKNNDGTYSITDQDKSNATEWTISGSSTSKTISTIIDGETYYLGATATSSSSANFTLTDNVTNWSYRSSNNRFSVNLSYNYRSYTYYISCANNNWGCTTSNSNSRNLTLTEVWDTTTTIINSTATAKEIICTKTEYIDSSTKNYYFDANGDKKANQASGKDAAGVTYFPLSTTVKVGENSYSISTNNTGYIVGAEWDTINREAHPDRIDSNIRISKYTFNENDNMTKEAKRPYAISYKTSNAFVQLPDMSGGITTSHRNTLDNYKLVKYADCYNDYLSSLTGENPKSTYWSGIHFMNAPILVENVTEITAHLNGRTIDNYQVPANCIDFNLYDRGFINAIAGSYYTQGGGNTSFFSLYQIFRDPDNEKIIVDIKEITGIYAVLDSQDNIDTAQEYKYTYKNEQSDIPKNYTLVFNCDWITNTDYYSGWAKNRPFYFEIPVNAGEYAIGSTEGENGAYLVYLDLAANAQLVERYKEYEKIVENSVASSLPFGVELLSPTDDRTSVSPYDSAFASINTNANGQTAVSGSISFSTTDGVTITHSATGGTSAEYIGTNNTLKDGNGTVMTRPVVTTTIERTTYRDHNLNTGDLTVTTITKTTVDDGSSSTVSYTKKVVTTLANGESTEESFGPQGAEMFPQTIDPSSAISGSPGEDLIKLYFVYGQKSQLETEYLYVPATKNESGAVTAPPKYVITITVKNSDSNTVDIKAALTKVGVDSGITFIITDGTTEKTLNNNEEMQTVSIAAKGGG